MRHPPPTPDQLAELRHQQLFVPALLWGAALLAAAVMGLFEPALERRPGVAAAAPPAGAPVASAAADAAGEARAAGAAAPAPHKHPASP